MDYREECMGNIGDFNGNLLGNKKRNIIEKITKITYFMVLFTR